LPQDVELGMHRQRTWVRQIARGDMNAARVEPAWGQPRGFPLMVWPPERLCLGLEGNPREASSRSAPVILKCRTADMDVGAETSVAEIAGNTIEFDHGEPSALGERNTGSAGVLLKRDAGMHREQQVGQTLRLMEALIWQDDELGRLLRRENLEPEDVRVTYKISMIGPDSAILEGIDGAHTLRDVRAGRQAPALRGSRYGGCLLEFLRQHNCSKDLPKALARLTFTAAVSAVLSFVAGLGDRHHENFMLTVDGRLLHVDYGYALGKEPFDSVLIHYAVQGQRPATTVQYQELRDAVGDELLEHVFWPTVRRAYLCIRQQAGLVAEMLHGALVREPRRDLRSNPTASQHAWITARDFVARRCATAMGEACAQRYIHTLLWHCARDERGVRFRDDLKGLCLREKTTHAVGKAYGAAVATGRHATAALGHASQEAGTAAKGVAAGLLGGVWDLLAEAGGAAASEPSRS